MPQTSPYGWSRRAIFPRWLAAAVTTDTVRYWGTTATDAVAATSERAFPRCNGGHPPNCDARMRFRRSRDSRTRSLASSPRPAPRASPACSGRCRSVTVEPPRPKGDGGCDFLELRHKRPAVAAVDEQAHARPKPAMSEPEAVSVERIGTYSSANCFRRVRTALRRAQASATTTLRRVHPENRELPPSMRSELRQSEGHSGAISEHPTSTLRLGLGVVQPPPEDNRASRPFRFTASSGAASLGSRGPSPSSERVARRSTCWWAYCSSYGFPRRP